MTLQRILLVEDDADIRLLFGLFLRNSGFAVAEAADGLEAIERLQNETFDLIILDLTMPRMDGMTALRILRQMPHGRDVPVLAVTAYNDREIEQRAMEAGATALLRKPFTPHKLLDAARAHTAAAAPAQHNN